ncbi:MAG TPA: radical SAM protein [Phycisphaerae bacterium]|nr:radical SAM protein [Phycisphaerae bacterium]
MRIALLSPPYKKDYMRNARCDFVSLSATQWYPLWLGYAGAWLEHRGHEVLLVDAPSRHLDHDQTEKLVLDWRPDMLVNYPGQQSRRNDVEFADRLTEKLGCITVLVGPYYSASPEETLRLATTVQYGVVSEFEHPLAELAEGKAPAEIRNLLYRDGDRIVRNEQRPYLATEQLDAIPFVARFFKEHVNIRDYKTISEFYPFMDLMTGRGCNWGQCTFCLWVHTFIKGFTYNVRSVDNVVEEFAYIERDLPEVRSVMIQDDMLTDDRALELSARKIKHKLKLPWSCYARSNLSYETMRVMRQAGCRVLHVGYESADPKILNNIRKGVSQAKMEEFTWNAKRAGLRIHGDFIIGFIGETRETAMKTIRWAKRLNPHTAQFQLANVLEGTPFHRVLKENGWLTPAGEPDYPDFRNEDIRRMAKQAYRSFYLSPQYALKCLRHPYEHFFGRLKTISVAIPAMFWRRW